MRDRQILNKFPTLIIALAISSLSLLTDVPSWTFLVALFFWIWKLLTCWLKSNPPSKKLTGFFSVIFFVLIYLEFKTYLGKESATSFIIILASL
ncbi:MAG: DUF3488 domain-containing protein, partial [Bdellovibrionales bacterium]|nr:DUF3488 domain-containing protein [Bdellovibrionales bacterium]